MNAVIQALCFFNEFKKYLSNCHNGKLVIKLKTIIDVMESSKCLVTPRTMVQFLKNDTQFQKQEDSHEFFLFLINELSSKNSNLKNPFEFAVDVNFFKEGLEETKTET